MNSTASIIMTPNRRMRRAAVRELRRRLRGWKAQGAVVKYGSHGQRMVIPDGKPTISQVIASLAQEGELERFLADKRVGPAEEQLFMAARGGS